MGRTVGGDYRAGMPDQPTRLDPLVVLDLAQTRAAAVLAAVEPDQHGLPGPCDDWSVGDEINKLIASTWLFTAFGNRQAPERDYDLVNPPDMMGDDPLGAFLDAAAACRAAWRAPGALDGMAPSTIGEARAKAVLHARVFDTTVISWDIAAACGIHPGIDDRQAAYVLRIARALVPAVRSVNAARYKDAVATPDDDPPLRQLIATTGRDPDWTPRPAV